MKKFEELKQVIKDKRVLFVTTKNLDYIRNSQEIEALQDLAEKVTVIGSSEKSYLKRLITVYKELFAAKMGDYDLVFVGFAPQLVLPLFGRKLKKKTLIIDFFISVYDTLVLDRAKLKKGSLAARACHRLDEKTLAAADYIVCDTMAHGEFFEKELGAKEEKQHVLYLKADSSIYYPGAADIAKSDTTHRILYFGSILPLQGVEVILKALTYFKDRPDYTFEIIGPVPDNYHKPDLSNVTYINWLSQQDLADHIRSADLCLAGHFSATIGKAKRTIPGKAYIYEACGRPMILGDSPANHELFSQDENHVFVKMGDPKALAQAIEEFF